MPRTPATALNALRMAASERGPSRSMRPSALSLRALAVSSLPSSMIITRDAIFSTSGSTCEAISTVCRPARERMRSRTAMT